MIVPLNGDSLNIYILQVDKMECKINPMEAELFNSGQPSPMSVLDPSFSTESCEFSTNAVSSEYQNRW